MDKAGILFPVAALATLTFAVLLLIPVRRFRAGFAGQVAYDDFKYGESARVPPEVAIPNRNLHLTYNQVRHRLLAFAASNVVLIMIWTNLLRALSS